MNAFVIELEDKPGGLAEIAEPLAAKGVNLYLFGLTSGDKGLVGLLASDDAATRATLDEIRCTYRAIEVIPVAMQHQPGQAATVGRKLAEAGVNIRFFVPTGVKDGRFVVALGCDDNERARRALGDQVVDGFGDLSPAQAMAHAM